MTVETAGGWEDDAACRGASPAPFFPEQGQTAAQAKEVCARCPVRQQCLAANLGEREGVWGGTTPAERRRIRVELGAAPGRPPKPSVCGSDAGYKRHHRAGEAACEACRDAHSRAQAARKEAAA